MGSSLGSLETLRFAQKYPGEVKGKFTSWSLQAKQYVVKDTEHYIHQYLPDLVSDEILALAKR
ncbi:hypothetical protein ACT8ZS_15910 [Paenibacillus sp. M.A.Huq-84]